MGYKFKIISGGNSSMLPQTMYNDLGKINELRIEKHYLEVWTQQQMNRLLVYIKMQLC